MATTTTYYADTALQMRKLADAEPDPSLKEQLMDLAMQYDRLAKRAEPRGGNGTGKL